MDTDYLKESQGNREEKEEKGNLGVKNDYRWLENKTLRLTFKLIMRTQGFISKPHTVQHMANLIMADLHSGDEKRWHNLPVK